MYMFFCCIFIHAYLHIYRYIYIFFLYNIHVFDIYIDIRFCTSYSKHTYRGVNVSHDTWVSVAKVTDALGSALAFVGLKNEVKEREDLGPRDANYQKKNGLRTVFLLAGRSRCLLRVVGFGKDPFESHTS